LGTGDKLFFINFGHSDGLDVPAALAPFFSFLICGAPVLFERRFHLFPERAQLRERVRQRRAVFVVQQGKEPALRNVAARSAFNRRYLPAAGLDCFIGVVVDMFPGAGAVSERVPQETRTGKVGGSPVCRRYSRWSFRVASLRYRISCESYAKTVALLLFGGTLSSHGNWFGLRCSWLLFNLYCRTLRTFATEAVGKLATIIRVNLGVVLGPRNRHIGEAVVNQEFAFVCVHVN
jgi:hypothetical protein